MKSVGSVQERREPTFGPAYEGNWGILQARKMAPASAWIEQKLAGFLGK
jgi:hypothetical protein